MRTFRLASFVLAGSLVLAACGGDTTATGSSSATAAATDAPSATATATDAATAEASAGDTRTVSHAMGETEVPATPERVVVLDTPHLDAALSLGVTPVAAVRSEVDGELPSYLLDRTEGVELVGTIAEPDLELIAATEPDLILSAQVRHEGIYSQLSEIAPTVFTASSGTNFKEGLATIADALNRVKELEVALGDYEDRAAEVGEAVGADELTATIARFLPDETRLYGPETFSGTVLTDIGFDLGDKGFADNEFSMLFISPEQAELAAADVIFQTTYGEPAETTLGDIEPLLEQLDAQRFDVDDDEWMLGIGLIGAEIVLDDVEELLAAR